MVRGGKAGRSARKQEARTGRGRRQVAYKKEWGQKRCQRPTDSITGTFDYQRQASMSKFHRKETMDASEACRKGPGGETSNRRKVYLKQFGRI